MVPAAKEERLGHQILDLFAAVIGDVVLMQLFENYWRNASNFLGRQSTKPGFKKGVGWSGKSSLS
jgi:hypothetical protein